MSQTVYIENHVVKLRRIRIFDKSAHEIPDFFFLQFFQRHRFHVIKHDFLDVIFQEGSFQRGNIFFQKRQIPLSCLVSVATSKQAFTFLTRFHPGNQDICFLESGHLVHDFTFLINQQERRESDDIGFILFVQIFPHSLFHIVLHVDEIRIKKVPHVFTCKNIFS